MNTLRDITNRMLAERNHYKQREAEYRFIEVLTFSTFDEINGMLNEQLDKDFISLPVWARNLAFRLVCLLEPCNPNIKRRAAADLRCFGPDWDAQADILDREAAELESHPAG